MMIEEIEEESLRKQREILQKLRENLSEILKPRHHDRYLLRFLRVEDFNLKKAEKAIRNKIRIENTYNVEKMLKAFKEPEVIKKYTFTEFIGPDIEGNPVRFLSFGSADVYGFLSSLSIFEIGRYGMYILEKDHVFLEEQMKKTGKSTEGIVYIFDMEGFSLQQIAYKDVIETGLDLLKLIQELYPEFVKHVIVINAPVYFYVIYNILKPILKQSVIEKIQVFAKDGWREVLTKLIEPHVLPKYLGGIKDEYDDGSKHPSLLTLGGTIPKNYYLSKNPKLDINEPGVKSTVIAARTTFRCVSAVKVPNSSISIEFRTEHHCIGFRMLYMNCKPENMGDADIEELDFDGKDEDNKVEVASPYSRILSHLAPVKSTLCCPHPGLYICVFDNMASMFYSKQLIYRIRVISP